MNNQKKIADLKETVRVMKEDLDRADAYIESANQRVADLKRELEAVKAENRLCRDQLEAANGHFVGALSLMQRAKPNA